MTAFWQWRGGDKQASQASAARQGVCMSASSQTQQNGAIQSSSLASCGTEQDASGMDLRSDSAFDGLAKQQQHMNYTDTSSVRSSTTCDAADLCSSGTRSAGLDKGHGSLMAQPGTPALGAQARAACSPSDSGADGSSPETRRSRSHRDMSCDIPSSTSGHTTFQVSANAALQHMQPQEQPAAQLHQHQPQPQQQQPRHQHQQQHQHQQRHAVSAPVGATYQQDNEPLFNHERYYKLRDLNRGAHGFVQLALDMKTGEQVAIKFLERTGRKMKTKHILRELLNQRLCAQHPHIVHLREAFLTPGHLGIAMEYATSGDLLDYVEAHMAHGMMVPEADARLLFQQLIVAMDYCHRLGIVNRDVKLDNILLHGDAPAILKLCDFGYSKDGETESDCKTACGTPEYMAPEVLKGEAYDGKAVDVWSCGCSLYILLCGDYPFRTAGHHQAQTPIKRMQAMFPRLVAGRYNPLRPEASEGVRDIMHRMLNPDPKQRITVAQIMAHPWFCTDLPAGVTELNETLLATAAAAEVDDYDAGCSLNPGGMRPEEIWRSRGVDGYNRQTIAELVALVEEAAQPQQVDLPWALPRLSLR